jgi:glucose dehydrogenase
MVTWIRVISLSAIVAAGLCRTSFGAGLTTSAAKIDHTRPTIGASPATGANSTAGALSLTGATANLAPNDPSGEWARQARDYANTRYSPLAQITRSNVSRLRMAWSFSDGGMYGREGAPLVIDDTMYIVTPFPNIAYALDLTKPGAPIKWMFEPNPNPSSVGEACCGVVLRG